MNAQNTSRNAFYSLIRAFRHGAIAVAALLSLALPSIANAQGAAGSSIQFVNELSQSGDTYNSGHSINSWLSIATHDWMTSLPDTTHLKRMSLPGTHDSCAFSGGLAVQTQRWGIDIQLQAGLRFLDIRTRRVGNALAIHHAAFYLNQNFDDVMSAVTQFLTNHPGEAVVMRVTADETTAAGGSFDFSTIWANYMKRYGNFIAQKPNSDPTLGSLRGKVLVLQANWSDAKWGLKYYDDNTFDVQDRYKVWFLLGDGLNGTDTANLPGKKAQVNAYLDSAAASSKWVLNYLSGSTGMAPSDVARATNGSAFDHIGDTGGFRCLGTVIMDFPGEQLIYRIIKSNFHGGDLRTITFNNQAGYVAKLTVAYALQGGKVVSLFGQQIPEPKVLETPNIPVGQSAKLVIPRDADKRYPIIVTIKGSGTIADPVYQTTLPFDFTGNRSFKCWKTIFDATGGPDQ